MWKCHKKNTLMQLRFYINNASCDELEIAISLFECVVKGWSMWKRIYSRGRKKPETDAIWNRVYIITCKFNARK